MATVKGPITICTNRKSSTRQVHKYLNKLVKSKMMMVRVEVMMYLLWMGLPICLAMSSSTSWRSTVT